MSCANFLFVDNESGEEFFVQEKSASTECKHHAIKVAREFFANPHFRGIYSDYEAECMGLDTY